MLVLLVLAFVIFGSLANYYFHEHDSGGTVDASGLIYAIVIGVFGGLLLLAITIVIGVFAGLLLLAITNWGQVLWGMDALGIAVGGLTVILVPLMWGISSERIVKGWIIGQVLPSISGGAALIAISKAPPSTTPDDTADKKPPSTP